VNAGPAATAPPPPPLWRRASGRRTPERPCLNCGDPTVGNYCPTCGQRKLEVRVSMRRMLMEALEDQFSLNATAPRTLAALFFRPGHLTREYVAGRIARYVPPFRLYLVSSLVFFLALSLVPEVRRGPVLTQVEEGQDGLRFSTKSGRDSARAVPMEPEGARRLDQPGWMGSVSVNTGVAELDSLLLARLQRLNTMPANEAAREVMSEYLRHVPQMMFALLPVFAAVLALLYLRQKRYYVEHFVFALHTFAFAFLTYTLMVSFRHPMVMGVLTTWLLVYIYLAMKRFYGLGWFRTGIKYLLLGAIYSVMMTVASVLLLILTVATM
jgi:uncharacterized protein DUF3667